MSTWLTFSRNSTCLHDSSPSTYMIGICLPTLLNLMLSSKSFWIIDSSALQHICVDAKYFTTLWSLQNSEVILTNNAHMLVHMIANVQLNLVLFLMNIFFFLNFSSTYSLWALLQPVLKFNSSFFATTIWFMLFSTRKWFTRVFKWIIYMFCSLKVPLLMLNLWFDLQPIEELNCIDHINEFISQFDLAGGQILSYWQKNECGWFFVCAVHYFWNDQNFT